MQDDDLPDDDASPFSDPLHPDDRLWRHPSEMRSVPAPGARSIPDTVDFAPLAPPDRPFRWGAVVASSLVGASAALLAVLVTGMGERVVERDGDAATAELPTTLSVSTTAPSARPEDAVIAVMPSVAQVVVTTPEATVGGSALVIRADGYLLTDAQVLDGAESIVVTFSDGTSETGELIAVDPVTELAVIRVPRTDLQPAATGDPAGLLVGQVAMAFGSNEGGQPSISSGVISAMDDRSTGTGGTPLYGMIRFDAPVPAEVAGGPLVTESGEVVGLTAKVEGSAGFGWATPIDDAQEIAVSLIEDGRATHAWLGIEGRRTAEGPVVMVVAEGSPAAEAGLEVDDVLVSVDGEPVTSMTALVAIIRDREPGDQISIAYRRGQMEWSCIAVLGRRS